jgi:hypothetical protein
MISTLRSIDGLLKRFNELSKCHENLLSHFERDFSDIKNPLRNVARTDEEQQETTTIISLDIKENNDQLRSIATLEDFHRRIVKTQYLHRPPNYSSNNDLLINHVPFKSSVVTTKSVSLPKISKITSKINPSQPKAPNKNKNIIESKVKSTRKIKPNVVQENSLAPRRGAHGTITAFTMKTVNRLSKPKTSHRLSDQKPSIQSLEPYENIKKEACLTLPPIKRTKTAFVKPPSKKLKAESKIPIQTSKRNPVSNFSRPLAFIALAPTVRLTFPTSSQQNSSHSVHLPKIMTTTKKFLIHLKT